MLKKRIIRTTIKLGKENKVFTSQDGRFGDLVTMRQDFEVKAFVNIGATGLHTAKIQLFNLTNETSKKIEQVSQLVLLEAGWEGNFGKIFEGRISSVGRTKPSVSNPDIVTTLYCVSGLETIQKGTFGETIIFEDILSFLGRLAERLGLFLTADSDIQGVVSNQTFYGDIISVIKDLSTEFGFDFYITETNLVVKSTSEKPSIKVYDPTSGLLDIPVVTEMGVDLKVLLDPFINPGDWFNLDSKFANFEIGNLEYLDRVRGNQFKTFGRQVNNNRYQGTYRALELLHFGSSHEDIWETLIKGQGLYNVQDINNTKRLSIT